jgi:transposase-like protein
MKKKSRGNFTAEFKARAAFEAARGLKTINGIAAEHDLHPVQVGRRLADPGPSAGREPRG